jgi:hypothetical protein
VNERKRFVASGFALEAELLERHGTDRVDLSRRHIRVSSVCGGPGAGRFSEKTRVELQVQLTEQPSDLVKE